MSFFQTRPKLRQSAPAAEIQIPPPGPKREEQRSSAFATGPPDVDTNDKGDGTPAIAVEPADQKIVVAGHATAGSVKRLRRLAKYVPRGIGSWICVAAISLPFVVGRFSIWVSAAKSPGDSIHERPIGPEQYQLFYEAHQMYDRDPDRLNVKQLANVKHSCRCAQILRKYASCGLDSLSDDECRMLVEYLPKRYPNLDEFPAYIEMLQACRRRLDGKDD
ncbi:MAG TPA: hypothetical protein VGX78_10375 [Pirellulales bacterium]|jgi:hypothetical protein|nr:hypothetical protein [Pirellulales bacterium]